MKYHRTLQGNSRLTAMLGVVLSLLWMGLNLGPPFDGQHGIIRLILAPLFAALVLLRPMPRRDQDTPEAPHPSTLLITMATLAGAAAVALGVAMPGRQVEWIGILLLTYACLSASLPGSCKRDIPLALLVLYWAHPLPPAVFTALQRTLQTASVRGAEWVLHMVSVPVWADGTILRTGTAVFEVPIGFSGMRAATTLFILSLALGILRRLKPGVIILFIAWSLVHAVALNSLRIAAMVRFASGLYGSDGSRAFLQDTAGLIVIAGVFLVYIELLTLEHYRQRKHQRRDMLPAALDGALSEYPPFWHRLRHRRLLLSLIVLLTASSTAVTWRSRPYHRLMMWRTVAGTLQERGEIRTARGLASILAPRLAEDLDWRLSTIRLHLISEESQQALEALDELGRVPPLLERQRDVLKAYALHDLGRVSEALEIMEAMPPDERRNDPLLSLILAEMALRRDDHRAVAEHLTDIGRRAPDINRVRRFYPYLRLHRQWEAMAATDVPVPYQDPAQAFCILEAFMNLDNRERIAAITMDSVHRYPGDPRLIEPLFHMALLPGGEWESRFRHQLLLMLPTLASPEAAYRLLEKCFHLARPDLAWAVYSRMLQQFPGDPLLDMAPAEYGHRWFVFRRHWLGFPADAPSGTTDLHPFFRIASLLPGADATVRRVPLGQAFDSGDIATIRRDFLRAGLQGFATMPSAHETPLPDRLYRYALALERSGRIDLALAKLDEITTHAPDQAETVRAVKSEMYERKGAWVHVYETLRTAGGQTVTPSEWPPRPPALPSPDTLSPTTLRRLIDAQLELQMMPAAEYTARQAVRRHPERPSLRARLATVLTSMGDTESALQLLETTPKRTPEINRMEADAIVATQRYADLEPFSRHHYLPLPRLSPETAQAISLPPAELALLHHHVALPSERQFATAAHLIRSNLSTAGDGLRPALTLWLEAWAQRCEGDLGSLTRWQSVARDRLEQASALHQLTLLLCREERFAEALAAARAAVAALPGSAPLWRFLVSLDGGRADTITLARQFCPDDTELWLADLVARTHTAGASPATGAEPGQGRGRIEPLLEEALSSRVFHVAGIARAADYLQRGGLHEEASRLCSTLHGRERGLLPIYLLSLQSALHTGDRHLALQQIHQAVNASLAPLPSLYEHLISLKSDGQGIDTDTGIMNALRALRRHAPENLFWPQLLGWIRFQRGGQETLDAIFEMNAALDGGATNLTPHLVAAEGYRQLRHYDRAADVLRRALEYHPAHPVLINNLAFTLAQDEKNMAEVKDLLPALTAAADGDPRIRDTLAVVHIRTGDLLQAHAAVVLNLRDATPGEPLWFRSQMRLAEIVWRQGNDQTAISMLEQLLRSTRSIPDEDLLDANTLFSRITAAPAGGADLDTDVP